MGKASLQLLQRQEKCISSNGNGQLIWITDFAQMAHIKLQTTVTMIIKRHEFSPNDPKLQIEF